MNLSIPYILKDDAEAGFLAWPCLILLAGIPVVVYVLLAGWSVWPSSAQGKYWPPRRVPVGRWAPSKFFWYQVVWGGATAFFVLSVTTNAGFLKQPMSVPAFVGVMSPWAILGGLIGGITISVVGISRHAHEWDGARYGYWHLARPFLGMITGSIAVLMLLFVLNGLTGVDSKVSLSPDKAFDGGAHAFMFVVAFVVGYREASFREIVKRVADLLFTKPEDESPAGSMTFMPSTLQLAAVEAAANAAMSQVTGTVLFVNATAEIVTGLVVAVSSDRGAFTVTPAAPTNVDPYSAVKISLTWEPEGATANETAELAVQASGKTYTMSVTGKLPG